MSKFSGGGSRLFLRAGFRPRGVIGLPGGSLMPKQGGFHETDRQSFGQKSARPGAGPLFLAVFCPELAVQPGPARSAALSLYHPLLPGLFGAGFLPGLIAVAIFAVVLVYLCVKSEKDLKREYALSGAKS